MKKLLLVLALYCPLVFATPVAQLNTLIGSIQTLTATFDQKVYSANMQLSQSAQGSLEFKKPNQFRWQVTAPDELLILSDGNLLWNYDALLEQASVEKFDVRDGVSPLSFLFADLGATYTVEAIGADKYKLTPKVVNSNFRYLELSFKDNKLAQLSVYDNLDQTTVFEFSAVKNNVVIPTSRFTFTPPAGVDVIGAAQ